MRAASRRVIFIERYLDLRFELELVDFPIREAIRASVPMEYRHPEQSTDDGRFHPLIRPVPLLVRID